MGVVIERFDVLLIRLDPTAGSELRKTRPCVVLSPNEMNRHIATLIVAPLTSRGQDYPTRVPLRFGGKSGQIVLDQVRTIDRSRVLRRLGRIDGPTATRTLEILRDLFAP